MLESGDADLAHAIAAPTFGNREATSGPAACQRPGPAGLLASSAWMRSAFDDLHFDILDEGYTDSGAWLHLKMQGLHARPFVQYQDGRPAQVLPPTGRRIDAEQTHVLTISDAVVTGHKAVRDDLTMLTQLGVFPPGPGLPASMALFMLSGRRRRAIAELEATTERAGDIGGVHL